MKQEIKDLISRARWYGDNYGLNAAPELALLADEVERLDGILNTPEFFDFIKAVPLEAAHQVQRWGSDHDAGKQPQDWFWLIGYLAGKALRSHLDGNTEKALHHCISSAAALSNWHAAILGASDMRPGIMPPTDRPIGPGAAGAQTQALCPEPGIQQISDENVALTDPAAKPKETL